MKKIKTEDLKKIDLVYKDKINIPDNPFGIEIEFAKAKFYEVDKNLKETLGYAPAIVGWRWHSKQKEIEDKNERWILKDDSTVQSVIDDGLATKLGGEINSPIMRNEKKYWQELKLVCETLRNTQNIEINTNCSVHIHADKRIYENIQEYKNLFKLIMIYEDIAYRILFGETNQVRHLLSKYAKPISYHIYQNLEELDKMEKEQDLSIFTRYDRKTSFNFRNIIKNGKQTIENRMGNPTLNEKIIQNYALFVLNFLNYAKEENFDEELINHKIKKYEPLYLHESLKEKPKKAIELLDLIIKDDMDKIYLLKQYLKEFNEHDIEKTYHL